jgi:hypothetical protein
MLDNPSILLTVDVEDWFQVENFKKCIHFSAWDSFELQLKKYASAFDLFDSIKTSVRRHMPGGGHLTPCAT